MRSSLLVLGSAALAAAQVPPAPVLLTATKSGVLPYLPTNFHGVETLEGAIIYDGPMNTTVTGLYGNASIQQNQAGITYKAVLPSTNFDNLTGSIVTGSVTAVVPSNGTGVQFSVSFAGLPSGYGQFVYHIHGLPVPADGNCTSTLGHLDTTDRGEYYPCNPAQPETCQVGDLAGKHGNATSAGSFTANYTDLYVSTNPSNSYFGFAGSIVVHTANTTRLTCANWTLISAGTASNYTNATFSSAVASIASAISSGNAAATAGANSSSNATATSTSSGSSSTSKSSTSSTGAAAGSSGASSTSAAATSTSSAKSGAATAVMNVAGAVLGGVAFVAGVIAL